MEWGNTRQAWDWLVATRSAKEVTACAETIFNFCMIRSRLQEGIELFSQAEKSLGAVSGAQAKILTYLGVLAYRMMALDLCEDAINRAMQLYDTVDQPADRALCCVFASGLASRQKSRERALQLCEEALEIFTAIGDSWGQSYAWFQLGLLKRRAGKFAEARLAIENSLEAARVIGDQRRQIGPLNMLGDLDCQQGAYPEAQICFEESLALSRGLHDPYNIAQALINLGTAHHYLGHFGQAQQCYEESLSISHEYGDLNNRVLALTNLGELALEQERFADGLAYSQQGLALAVQANDEWTELICWINLADAALGLQDEAGASQYLSRALPIAVQMNDLALKLRVLLHNARLRLMRGETREALELFGLVLHHEATYDEHRQAVQKVLVNAGLPLPDQAEITLEAALNNLKAAG
jgi:tetratricopeptide (TPR) repeat protein